MNSYVFYLPIYYQSLVRPLEYIYFLCLLETVVEDVYYDYVHFAKLCYFVSSSLTHL